MTACLLCHSIKTEQKCTIDNIVFLHCNNCQAVFKNPNHFLSAKAEKERYLLHQNNVDDKHYQKFVSPIVNAVQLNYSINDKGLDFGAGTGPVISKLLSKKGYSINLYDPFFYPDTVVLKKKYNFIICCEVIEHFQSPDKDFKLLNNLLDFGGTLFCMTELIPKNIPFEKWHYIRDKTHIIFYSEACIFWIKENLGFTEVNIDGRLIEFKK